MYITLPNSPFRTETNESTTNTIGTTILRYYKNSPKVVYHTSQNCIRLQKIKYKLNRVESAHPDTLTENMQNGFFLFFIN